LPEKAVEICTESLACLARGLHRECMMDTMEGHDAGFDPCTLPSPFTKRPRRSPTGKRRCGGTWR
jgi:hypothetical protein